MNIRHCPFTSSSASPAAALVVLTLLLTACPTGQSAEYAIGADLSFLKQAEDGGTVFKDGGQVKPGLRIFRDHGYNWIRLRLFHTPRRLPNNLDYTIALTKEARKLGFKFLLDYHYSDTWADPGKQRIPEAWQGKSHDALVQAVFEYTRDTITAFRKSGVLPDNLDRLRTTGGLEAVERMRLVDPGNGLIVTNVSKFPHDPIDFGNGPFTQEFTPVNYTGTAVIVSGPDGMVKVRLAYPELVAT